MSFNDLTAASILIPIAAGIIKFKPASRLERSVLLFLVFGFLFDASDALGYSDETRHNLVAAYSLSESLFFLFLLYYFFDLPGIKKAIKILSIVFFSLWFCSFYLFAHVNDFFDLVAKLYDMLYDMVVSFLSGVLLLKMVEKEKPYGTSSFWFVLALFTSCFTTFFLEAFIRDNIAHKIWWLHGVMNLLAYILFTIAFLIIKKQPDANNIYQKRVS